MTPSFPSEEHTQLHNLLDKAWDFEMEESPFAATVAGDSRFNDRLPSVGPEHEARRARYRDQTLARLGEIDRAHLDTQDRTSYDMFRLRLEDALTAFRFDEYLMPLTNRGGFHVSFADLPRKAPLQTARDYENYIARLDAFPLYVEQHIALLRQGVERGMVLPGVVLDGYELSIEAHVVDDVFQSIFHGPFEGFPPGVPETERPGLAERGRISIMENTVPAYRTFLRFIVDEYLPGCRSTVGASELPDGKRYYEYLVRHFTTLQLSPEEVHQIGLDEVKRLRAEMEEVIERVAFDGDFSAFLTFLRTDPRFYATDPDELLKEAAYIQKRMDGLLPRLFGRLPRLPYGIKPIPDYIAPKMTGAYYERGAGDGSKAGYYNVNTYALESRPLYVLEALSLHEAVPGHHLQLALQQELDGLPNFRRFEGVTAFVEGWGLYSERLGLEVGFFADPYNDFGRLTYEIWRACRLVVDTGIHAFGWTRQEAIDYMAGRTALSIHECTTEVDRYIACPGQALAYKMGELTITRLRREAESALGEWFDVRAFHDVVLGSGSVPLTILESQVRTYIDGAQAEES
jgi:uncharacterized protein (DUF885 family)